MGAYETLSNEDKRSTYDRFGSEGVQNMRQGGGGGFHGGIDPNDIFRAFFDGQDPFEGAFGDIFGPGGLGGGLGGANVHFASFGPGGASFSFSSSGFGGGGPFGGGQNVRIRQGGGGRGP